jgi:hypothetical protein
MWLCFSPSGTKCRWYRLSWNEPRCSHDHKRNPPTVVHWQSLSRFHSWSLYFTRTTYRHADTTYQRAILLLLSVFGGRFGILFLWHWASALLRYRIRTGICAIISENERLGCGPIPIYKNSLSSALGEILFPIIKDPWGHRLLGCVSKQ